MVYTALESSKIPTIAYGIGIDSLKKKFRRKIPLGPHAAKGEN